MAWSFIRKGEPQNAMAISKSLVAPAMIAQSVLKVSLFTPFRNSKFVTTPA